MNSLLKQSTSIKKTVQENKTKKFVEVSFSFDIVNNGTVVHHRNFLATVCVKHMKDANALSHAITTTIKKTHEHLKNDKYPEEQNVRRAVGKAVQEINKKNELRGLIFDGCTA